MTKEIYYEGWLIKSPPTKRIWRARWRKRWFTLKQGEIPEQFCLEYYTDRNCRKLKGVIDLDQCEQVDSGLRLEHRKQKFQYMFDVKTPRRTYYLAADSEEDMNEWVNCICQVCNLQDLSKQQQTSNDNRQYYNVCAESIVNQPAATSSPIITTLRKNQSPSVENRTSNSISQLSPSSIDRSSISVEHTNDNNNSVYQNFDVAFHNTTYNNRETLICDGSLNRAPASSMPQEPRENYYNFVAIANDANRLQQFERSHSMRTTTNNETNSNDTNGLPTPNHGRTQSLIERKTTSTLTRKIPENLKLNDSFANNTDPLPSVITSSGPYIAISECISGNPLIDRDNPMTPLNSLDPKFYETPRSHINNIGLNLTNEQPYSPKRNNCPTTQSARVSRSGRSSPTDSESVFTDDEEWTHTSTTDATGDRKLRPSDSSVENDSIVFTYAHRFSKLRHEENSVSDAATAGMHVHSRRSRQVPGLLLEEDDNDERNKEVNSSDTENASPAITFGPKDNTSCVEENYDIPRSHHLPYYNLTNNNSAANDQDTAMTPLIGAFSTAASSAGSTSTLNSSTLQRSRPHFYTNAAPTKVEGNVFRYDFDEQQTDAPAVDRKLKPKINHQDEKDEKNATIAPPTKPARPISSISIASSVQAAGVAAAAVTSTDLRPPCIDRKLKPATPIKYETCSLRRRGGPSNLSFAASASDIEFHTDLNADKFSKTLPRNYNNSSSSATAVASVLNVSLAPMAIASNASGRQIGKLDYFDLDHSNPPPICKNANTSASTSDLSSYLPNSIASSNQSQQISSSNRHSGFAPVASSTSTSSTATGTMKKPIHIDPVGTASTSSVAGSGIVYKSVDFIKTEAFMRTRQDAELNRAKNRLKE